jgi:hypothetical protein
MKNSPRKHTDSPFALFFPCERIRAFLLCGMIEQNHDPLGYDRSGEAPSVASRGEHGHHPVITQPMNRFCADRKEICQNFSCIFYPPIFTRPHDFVRSFPLLLPLSQQAPHRTALNLPALGARGLKCHRVTLTSKVHPPRWLSMCAL